MHPQVLLVGDVEIPALQHRPGLVNGTDSELRLSGRTQLAHQDHVELTAKGVGNDSSIGMAPWGWHHRYDDVRR